MFRFAYRCWCYELICIKAYCTTWAKKFEWKFSSSNWCTWNLHSTDIINYQKVKQGIGGHPLHIEYEKKRSWCKKTTLCFFINRGFYQPFSTAQQTQGSGATVIPKLLLPHVTFCKQHRYWLLSFCEYVCFCLLVFVNCVLCTLFTIRSCIVTLCWFKVLGRLDRTTLRIFRRPDCRCILAVFSSALQCCSVTNKLTITVAIVRNFYQLLARLSWNNSPMTHKLGNKGLDQLQITTRIITMCAAEHLRVDDNFGKLQSVISWI